MIKNNKKLTILLVEISLVGFFSIGMYSYMQKELKPVDVYVYKNKIIKNSEIEMSDLRLKSIPAKAKDSGFLTESDIEAIKKGEMIAATDVEVGQYAYSTQIKPSDKIDPFETIDLTNYRKISIPISYETSMAGEIKRGDKVDLVFTGIVEDEKEGEGSYAKTFIQEVLVYNVTTGEGFEYVNHSNVKKSETVVADEDSNKDDMIAVEDLTAPALVTLAVPINQAEEILARLEKGTVKILGRFEESENVNSPGFVYGVSDSKNIPVGEKNIERK